MSHSGLKALVTIGVMAGVAAGPTAAHGQPQDGDGETATWTLPRTADGQPDLQGYWTTQTFTPLERPDRLAGKEFFSEEEAAALHEQFTAEGVDPLRRDAIETEDPELREQQLYQVNRDPSYVHYDNEIWLRTPTPKGLSSRRTSLITDPPDGRIPPLTRLGESRMAIVQARRNNFDSHETRPLMERCIIWTHEGPPMLPPAYNDIHQIFQTPDYIVIFTELSTGLPRIIPLDGRPFNSDKVPQYGGESRARWDGDTLVVESKNFVDRRIFRGSTEFRHVTERFTRVSEDRIHYEFTITDPTTWTRSWSGEVPMMATEGPMYEYGCHEGNYDIRNILEINRNLEAQAAASTDGELP